MRLPLFDLANLQKLQSAISPRPDDGQALQPVPPTPRVGTPVKAELSPERVLTLASPQANRRVPRKKVNNSK